MKHGARLIEIAPGKKAIEVGPVNELPDKLTILRQAVVAGELDAAIGSLVTPRELPKKKAAGITGRAAAVKL